MCQSDGALPISASTFSGALRGFSYDIRCVMEQFFHFDDEALQALAADGDAEAEEALVRRFSRLVRCRARPLFLAGGDSEDLTQEGMMGLLSAIRSFCPALGASFQTYAETCIRHRLITAVKSASRYKHSPLNEAVSFESSQFDESRAVFALCTPEEQVLAQERAGEMWEQFIRVLSAFEQDVLRLFLDGLSYQEMAECLGKSTKSVDNAVQRIRKKLAQ